MSLDLLGAFGDNMLEAFGGASVPTLASVRSGSATIRKGARGDSVKYVQSRVGVSADGVFGDGTEAAVKKFQKSMGLDADGIVGRETMEALDGVYIIPEKAPSVATDAPRPARKEKDDSGALWALLLGALATAGLVWAGSGNSRTRWR